jgi:hypothetical protein
MSNKSIPILIHIPKTGGTTIRTLLTMNYTKESMFLVSDGGVVAINKILSKNVKNIEKFKIISGHFPYGAHYHLNMKNPRYFVFLRNPVERMFSDINHVRRVPEHLFYNELGGGDLELDQVLELAKKHYYYNDTMTHYISGLYFTRRADMSDLHRAIDNLWKSELVGVSDRFEESQLMMAKKLGWKNIIGEKLNVANKKQLIDDALKKSANEVLTYDNSLYAVAQDIVEKNIKKHGTLLTESAEQLRQIYEKQSELDPLRKYDEYLIGDELPMRKKLEALVGKSSPLEQWIKMIK